MGNVESDLNKNDKLTAQDKERILQQNLLQQEKRQQALEAFLVFCI